MIAGIPEFVRMKLMRHSDIRLTQAIYTDDAMAPVWSAVASLPSIGDTAIDALKPVESGPGVSATVPINSDNPGFVSNRGSDV
jgi:hypothetical protein